MVATRKRNTLMGNRMPIRISRFPVFILLVVLLIPTASWSDEETTRGKAIYERECQTCHGINGTGSELDWAKPLDGPGLRYPPPPSRSFGSCLAPSG
ncbi:c-type cytochrome [Magnetococcales bacterium HHB-1]